MTLTKMRNNTKEEIMMINIKTIKENIIKETTDIVCKKYGFVREEVKVSFKSDGDLNITIAPKELMDKLSVNVSVESEE